MPETPYCPLLSINKDVPVLCQEELCMWYVKQLKLCSITVLAYTNALNMHSPGSISPTQPQAPHSQSKQGSSQAAGQKPQATAPQPQLKPNLSKEPKNPETKGKNPFALDDLD